MIFSSSNSTSNYKDINNIFGNFYDIANVIKWLAHPYIASRLRPEGVYLSSGTCALPLMPTDYDDRVQDMRLKGNMIGCEGATSLAEVFRANTTLLLLVPLHTHKQPVQQLVD